MNRLGLTPGWYIAVGIFLLSCLGYLLYKSAGGGREHIPLRYTLHRYKQIYPEISDQCADYFHSYCDREKAGARGECRSASGFYWELLGCRGSAWAGDGLYQSGHWYISVLFIAGFILWFFSLQISAGSP